MKNQSRPSLNLSAWILLVFAALIFIKVIAVLLQIAFPSECLILCGG